MSEEDSTRRARKAERNREWRRKNREYRARKDREYRIANRHKRAERQRAYTRKNPEKVKESNRRCRAKRRAYQRALYVQAKRAALKAYGGKCVCCGQEHECFLTIDHAKNDGAEHRRERITDGKQYGGNGFGIYRLVEEIQLSARRPFSGALLRL